MMAIVQDPTGKNISCSKIVRLCEFDQAGIMPARVPTYSTEHVELKLEHTLLENYQLEKKFQSAQITRCVPLQFFPTKNLKGNNSTYWRSGYNAREGAFLGWLEAALPVNLAGTGVKFV